MRKRKTLVNSEQKTTTINKPDQKMKKIGKCKKKPRKEKTTTKKTCWKKPWNKYLWKYSPKIENKKHLEEDQPASVWKPTDHPPAAWEDDHPKGPRQLAQSQPCSARGWGFGGFGGKPLGLGGFFYVCFLRLAGGLVFYFLERSILFSSLFFGVFSLYGGVFLGLLKTCLAL